MRAAPWRYPAWALAWLALGCERVAPPQTTADQGPPPIPTTAPAQPPATPLPPRSSATPGDAAWTWRGPEPGAQTFYRAPITTLAGGQTCRFVFDEARRTTTIECLKPGQTTRLWGVDEGGAFVENAALVTDDRTLYVARYSSIASGCEVVAYGLLTGQEAWRTRLIGLGSIAHSEYLNAVEVALDANGTTLQVLGWEARGKYIEHLDRRSGATLGVTRLDAPDLAPHVSPPLAPKADPPQPGEAAGAAFDVGSRRPVLTSGVTISGGGTCVYASDQTVGRETLACVDAASKRLWGFERGAFVGAAAVAADDQNVYVASYCAIASGATVTAYASATGHVRWRTRLQGVGPVSHSKYANVVGVRVDRGRVIVSGWESAGKYVEVLQASSGTSVGNRAEN